MIGLRKDFLVASPIINQVNDFFDTKLEKRVKGKIHEIVLENYQSLDFNKNKINSEINKKLKKGTIYAVTGDNGSGKTTLVEAILGYTDRFVGKIKINNLEDVFEDMVYISSNPVISDFLDDFDSNLSYGQKKLKQILLSIKTDKTVYLFDEPTNFLDVYYKNEVLNCIIKLNKEKKIIVLITHDKQFIRSLEQLNLDINFIIFDI